MLAFALVLLLVVGFSTVLVSHRLREGDRRAAKLVEGLREADRNRHASLARVQATVEDVSKQMQSWNTTVETKIREGGLHQLKAPTDRRDGFASGLDSGAEGATDVTIRQVISVEPGLVPDDFAASAFNDAVATVHEVRAQEHESSSTFFPQDPALPVHFIVPILGRPEHGTSARSVIATEDHEAALTIMVALLTRWSDAEVKRGTVAPFTPGSEWTNLRGHICTFCREKRNPLTRALLDHNLTRRWFHLSFPEETDQYGIILNGQKYMVPRQHSEVRDSMSDHEREDVALVARFPNPWYPDAKALVIAGTKAYGTWGAAHYLKNSWDELMQAVGTSDSTQPVGQRDFACVLSVNVTYSVASESDVAPPVAVNQEVMTVVKTAPTSVSASILGMADAA